MRKFILLAGISTLTLAACGKPPETAAPVEPPASAETAPAPSAEAAAAEIAPAETPFDVSMTVPGVYNADTSHAYITFSYDHQGYSRPWLRWRSWTGDLNWNPGAPEQSSIAVVIDAASIDSGVDKFDDHLKSADFFEVEKYPQITFNSTSVTIDGLATAKIAGDLTVKGATKPVTLDVKINRAADDDFAKGYKLGFSGKTSIKRSDFGVDKYTPFVGDDVEILIEAEFVMPKEEPAPAQ
ncbi:MAG: YceI family protein [Parvularculaceae bacterium]|nr:YceI family protein [Parvularculaceae bacterium]